MCLFWWNIDIYLRGTGKPIVSFSTANWINAPSGCWAGSKAENYLLLCSHSDGRIHFTFVCSTFTFPVHSQASLRKLTHTTKKIELDFFFFFPSTNPPLVSLRALILVVLCPGTNCCRDCHAPLQNADLIWNSSQVLEIFASGIFTQVISPYRASNTAPFSCQTPHRASHLVKKS